MTRKNGCCRIVLTGGPGGGKSTAADLFRREIGESVVIVPEAATLLFSGGFPRVQEKEAVCFAQAAIYAVQKNLEDLQSRTYPGRTLLCDRGTIDGAAYWPDEPEHFFEFVNSSLEKELERYDAVIFFESAAVGGMQIEGGNPTRTEDLEEACRLDKQLQALWSQHENYTLIPHNPSFFRKLTYALAAIEGVTTKIHRRNGNSFR